jgi:Ca2+-binding RTX toxin-like protein
LDTLHGGDGRDKLHGGADNDTNLGQEGDDLVLGGAGNDAQDGGLGNDLMVGGSGDDSQAGGAGDDRIFATLGRDTTDGGPGNDRLWALIRFDVTGPVDLEGDIVRGAEGDDLIKTRDGEQDIVNCGPGFDTARLDLVDVIEGASTTVPDGDCERVTRLAPRPGEDVEEQRQPEE